MLSIEHDTDKFTIQPQRETIINMTIRDKETKIKDNSKWNNANKIAQSFVTNRTQRF